MLRGFGGCMAVCLCLTVLSCAREEQDVVRLSGWVSSPMEEQLLMQMVAAFQKSHPDVKVNYEPIPGNYMDKIQLMLATSTAPDVFYLEAFYAPALVSYDVLEPLDAYIRKDSVNLSDFEHSLLGAFQFKGATYGLVKDYTTVGLFYNTDLFREAGIAAPPRTWEELARTAQRLTKDRNGDGKPDQWGLCLTPSLDNFLPFVFQNNASLFKKDGVSLAVSDTAFLEALRFYVGLYKDGYAMQPSEVGAAWPGDAFGKGNVAMLYSGNFAIPFLKGNYPGLHFAIAPLPRHKCEATVAYIVGYVMPRNCRRKEKAWQLLEYLTGTEGMAKWTSLGLALPPRKSVVLLNGVDRDSLRAALVAGASYARAWQLSEHFRIFDEVQTALQRIFLTRASTEKVMEELSNSWDRMLSKGRSR